MSGRRNDWKLTARGARENLTRVALAAEANGTATALAVARGSWMDVAKLSGAVPTKGAEGGARKPRPLDWAQEPPLTEDAWFERFAPDEP